MADLKFKIKKCGMVRKINGDTTGGGGDDNGGGETPTGDLEGCFFSFFIVDIAF